MGTKTGISWTSATWNPIRGCIRVSEGCRFCYAESVAARFSGPDAPYAGLAKWVQPAGADKPEARWTGQVMLVEKHLEDPLRWRKPRMIFVNSMSDFFFEKIPTEYRDRMMAVMGLAQHHTFQVLTKRAGLMHGYLSDPEMPARVLAAAELLKPSALWNGSMHQLRYYFEEGRPLPNVWWGVSAEDQETADERVSLLLDTPAAVRWVSYEPAIGPIDFERITHSFAGEAHRIDALRGHLFIEGYEDAAEGIAPLDWIVIGGESHRESSKARPFFLDWARDLVRQSQGDGVHTAVYVKQLGSNPVNSFGLRMLFPGKADQPEDFPEDIRIQNYPEAIDAHPAG